MYSQKTNPTNKQHIPVPQRLCRPVKAFMAITFIMFLCISAKTKASGVDTNWVKYKDTADVAIYYEITTCDSASAVFVNFVNSNSYDVQVEWADAIQAFGSWINTSGSSAKTIVVAQGATTGVDCNTTAGQCLISGKKWLSIPDYTITGFKLTSLKISKQ